MQNFLNAVAVLVLVCATIQVLSVAVFRRNGDPLLVFLNERELTGTERRWIVLAVVAVLWLIFGRI